MIEGMHTVHCQLRYTIKNMAIERHRHETSIRIHHLIVSQYSKIINLLIMKEKAHFS
jgi:hypothetical protein